MIEQSLDEVCEVFMEYRNKVKKSLDNIDDAMNKVYSCLEKGDVDTLELLIYDLGINEVLRIGMATKNFDNAIDYPAKKLAEDCATYYN